MQTNVDRVIASPTLKHPMPDAQSATVRDDVARFAARLLENYKDQLSRRCPDSARQLNASPRP